MLWATFQPLVAPPSQAACASPSHCLQSTSVHDCSELFIVDCEEQAEGVPPVSPLPFSTSVERAVPLGTARPEARFGPQRGLGPAVPRAECSTRLVAPLCVRCYTWYRIHTFLLPSPRKLDG